MKPKPKPWKKTRSLKETLKNPIPIRRIITTPRSRPHYWCKHQQGPHSEPPCCHPGPTPRCPAVSRTKRKPHKSARGKKTGLGRYTPTIYNVCPWALLIVMANVGRNGNCRRRRVKGILSVSEGVLLRRGMKMRLPLSGPVAISTSIMCCSVWPQ